MSYKHRESRNIGIPTGLRTPRWLYDVGRLVKNVRNIPNTDTPAILDVKSMLNNKITFCIMKALKLNLEKIKNLTAESKLRIESENLILTQKSGAEIEIIDVHYDLIKVQVKNVNGKKTEKHKLLSDAYRILHKNLPSTYRISIKL